MSFTGAASAGQLTGLVSGFTHTIYPILNAVSGSIERIGVYGMSSLVSSARTFAFAAHNAIGQGSVSRS